MPKMKTHSGTKKRIKITGKGRLLHERVNKRHLLEHKSSRRTRRLAGENELAKGDAKSAMRLLGKR
jgi:large subunit ribosomal protein L35